VSGIHPLHVCGPSSHPYNIAIIFSMCAIVVHILLLCQKRFHTKSSGSRRGRLPLCSVSSVPYLLLGGRVSPHGLLRLPRIAPPWASWEHAPPCGSIGWLHLPATPPTPFDGAGHLATFMKAWSTRWTSLDGTEWRLLYFCQFASQVVAGWVQADPLDYTESACRAPNDRPA